jgi:hypothetical protein
MVGENKSTKVRGLCSRVEKKNFREWKKQDGDFEEEGKRFRFRYGNALESIPINVARKNIKSAILDRKLL